MTDIHLTALAVEAIEAAEITTGIDRKAIHKPQTTEECKARSVAMSAMKRRAATYGEIARAFTVSVKVVRTAVKNLKNK